jgi:hypothetical protein
VNVLILGNGKGSWDVRGKQLGAAIGARVSSNPSDADWQWADRVVLVKNHGAKFAADAHRRGLPIVWDALDFWRQPDDNRSDERRAMALLQAQIKAIRPALVIGATQAMADACHGVYLPHHARPGLMATATRERVAIVAYEGNPLYLGKWYQILADQCKQRGWRFVVNPTSLIEADIIVAFRDGPWDGWICREWKSGVKLVNAMVAGRPVITQMSAAWRELNPVTCAIESVNGLSAALDRFSAQDERAKACEQPRARALTLEQVAARYRVILQDVRSEALC